MTSSETLISLLDGRLKLCTGEGVYNPPEDPLWLQAALPIKPEERVFEAGIGIGTASLALLTHTPHLHVDGLDNDDTCLTIATYNTSLNGAENALTLHEGDIRTWATTKTYHHTFANPPFHQIDHGFRCDSTTRQKSAATTSNDIETWSKKLLSLTKEGGTLTLIHHARNLPLLDTLFDGYEHHVVHLITKEGSPAKRVIFHVIHQKGARSEYIVKTYDPEIRDAILGRGERLWPYTQRT